MKKFFSTIDYITTIIFTTIHIFFVILTMNLSDKSNIEALATSNTYQKILLIITIIYLIVFIFVGNPAFYKSKVKRNFKLFIGFLKNIIYILNSIFIIQIATATYIEIINGEDLSFFEQLKRLNDSLKAFGLNGFYVFYMYITLVISTLRIISWLFKILLSLIRRNKAKKRLMKKQMKNA